MRRTLRSCFLGAAALALAVVSSAQVRVLPLEALAPVGVPPLLVGTPSAPAPALSAALSLQTQAVAALPVEAASAFLAERAVSAAPAERAAAKLVAANLVAAEIRAAAAPAHSAAATPSPADPGLRELAESAHTDPSLAAWFDGAKAAPSLELDGLTLKRGTWRRGEAKLERLGQGEFGFVDVHPTVPGAVIKTVVHSAEIQLFSNASPSQTAAQEEETAKALSAADAGPRHFGRTVHDGYLVSVRERVFGDTLEKLGRGRRLGPAERELVEDLLRRLAVAGLKPDDLRPSNIMIGRTSLDPRRRAYVVDGGKFKAVPAGLDAEGRYQDLMREPIVLRGRFDPNIGWVEYSKPMALILDEGVERSGRTTRWRRFKGFWKDLPRMLTP